MSTQCQKRQLIAAYLILTSIRMQSRAEILCMYVLEADRRTDRQTLYSSLLPHGHCGGHIGLPEHLFVTIVKIKHLRGCVVGITHYLILQTVTPVDMQLEIDLMKRILLIDAQTINW